MKKHLSNQTRKRMLSILGMLLLSVPFVLAQVLVKGTVKDNLGEGVPGASVQVKGTSQGTITDLDGKFTLNIPQKNATLVISFIGYVTVEQKADCLLSLYVMEFMSSVSLMETMNLASFSYMTVILLLYFLTHSKRRHRKHRIVRLKRL